MRCHSFTESNLRWKRLGLAAIALMFGGGGIAVSILAILPVCAWSAARQWVPAEAHIETLEFRSLPGEGRIARDSYRVDCHYRYTFDGHDYAGSRVGLSQVADNIGSWQQDRYAELQARRSGTVTCWVNPANPAESVLFRDFRPGLLVVQAMIALPCLAVSVSLVVSLLRGRAPM